jgi:hypothetical protein
MGAHLTLEQKQMVRLPDPGLPGAPNWRRVERVWTTEDSSSSDRPANHCVAHRTNLGLRSRPLGLHRKPIDIWDGEGSRWCSVLAQVDCCGTSGTPFIEVATYGRDWDQPVDSSLNGA